jgi:hypothetical protein
LTMKRKQTDERKSAFTAILRAVACPAAAPGERGTLKLGRCEHRRPARLTPIQLLVKHCAGPPRPARRRNGRASLTPVGVHF